MRRRVLLYGQEGNLRTRLPRRYVSYTLNPTSNSTKIHRCITPHKTYNKS